MTFKAGSLLRTKTREELIKELWDKQRAAAKGLELSATAIELLKLRERDLGLEGFFFGNLNDDGIEKYPEFTYITYTNEHLFIVPYGYSGLLFLEKKLDRFGNGYICKLLFEKRIAWLREVALVKI